MPPAAVPAPKPVSVSVHLLNGLWGEYQYTIAGHQLTLWLVPADAVYQRLVALDSATYRGIPNELLDGGGIL